MLVGREGFLAHLDQKIPRFVLKISPILRKIPKRAWSRFEALISVFPTHSTDLRENGCDHVKNVLEKGSKMEKSGPGRTGFGPFKKVRTLLLYQFFVPNQTAHSKFSKTHSKSRQKLDF